MTSLCAEGTDLFMAEDFAGALEKYSAAIAEDSTSADFFVKRSAAHQKLGSFTEALEDANAALALDAASDKAYFRKGVACFSMDEFETAKAAFQKGLEAAKERSQPTSTFQTWVRKCDAEIDDEEDEEGDEDEESKGEAAPPPEPVVKAPLFKHDWYQTASHVTVTVMAKGQSKECVNVDIKEAHLTVSIRGEGGGEPIYTLDIDTFGQVVPGDSIFKVLKSKIEVKLCKQAPVQWAALEGGGIAVGVGGNPSLVAASVVEDKKSKPYASDKDWEALDRDLKKAEEDEKPEGDEALNKLFRDIYSKATPETRRAMNKSFQTSGGTVLSTNWNEVGDTNYEDNIKPPDGMQWNKNTLQ